MSQWLIKHVGIPYSWGGSNVIKGYDCSGLAQEFLLSFGAHPDKKIDLTAQGIFNKLEPISKKNIYDVGALVFFGPSIDKINHVGIVLSDKIMLEAGGGGSKTNTVSDAINQNAFVRIRPINNRVDFLTCLMPKKIMELL